MKSTTPELFGRVSFAKVSGSTASTAISLVKNIYYSTENPNTAISQNVSYVIGDCVTSSNVIVMSSSSSIASSSAVTYSSSPAVTYPSSSRLASSSISSSSLAAITITITPNTQVPNISIPSGVFGQVFPPNGIPATFKFPGSNTSIIGIISNNIFIPNLGQLVPSDALTFYGANSFGTGTLVVGSQSYSIPTNVVRSDYVPATGGGSITISLAQSSQATSSSSVSQQANAIITTPQAGIEVKNTGVFKSKLHITDPYICGTGSYGNVPNAKELGVENVYYDFYKVGSSIASYNFKLKLNANGDFFLPISSASNKITEGNYKIVYYALDNEGNKAQGEFTDFITDKCLNSKTGNDYNSIRTGGSNTATILVLIICLIGSLAAIVISKNKEIYNQIFSNKK